jgi:hypothetical protein
MMRIDPCVMDSDADPDYHLANFIYQVMKGVAERTTEYSPECSCCYDICQYHEHESKEEWEASTSTHSIWFSLITYNFTACGQEHDMVMPASLKQPE